MAVSADDLNLDLALQRERGNRFFLEELTEGKIAEILRSGNVSTDFLNVLANALDHAEAPVRLRLVHRGRKRPRSQKVSSDWIREFLELGECVWERTQTGEKVEAAIEQARREFGVSRKKAFEAYGHWRDSSGAVKGLLDLMMRTTDKPESR